MPDMEMLGRVCAKNWAEHKGLTPPPEPVAVRATQAMRAAAPPPGAGAEEDNQERMKDVIEFSELKTLKRSFKRWCAFSYKKHNLHYAFACSSEKARRWVLASNFEHWRAFNHKKQEMWANHDTIFERMSRWRKSMHIRAWFKYVKTFSKMFDVLARMSLASSIQRWRKYVKRQSQMFDVFYRMRKTSLASSMQRWRQYRQQTALVKWKRSIIKREFRKSLQACFFEYWLEYQNTNAFEALQDKLTRKEEEVTQLQEHNESLEKEIAEALDAQVTSLTTSLKEAQTAAEHNLRERVYTNHEVRKAVSFVDDTVPLITQAMQEREQWFYVELEQRDNTIKELKKSLAQLKLSQDRQVMAQRLDKEACAHAYATQVLEKENAQSSAGSSDAGMDSDGEEDSEAYTSDPETLGTQFSSRSPRTKSLAQLEADFAKEIADVKADHDIRILALQQKHLQAVETVDDALTSAMSDVVELEKCVADQSLQIKELEQQLFVARQTEVPTDPTHDASVLAALGGLEVETEKLENLLPNLQAQVARVTEELRACKEREATADGMFTENEDTGSFTAGSQHEVMDAIFSNAQQLTNKVVSATNLPFSLNAEGSVAGVGSGRFSLDANHSQNSNH